MATVTYRRTKIIKNGKVVGYKYPNAASRKYYESKAKYSAPKKKKLLPVKGKAPLPKYDMNQGTIYHDYPNHPKGKDPVGNTGIVPPKPPKSRSPLTRTGAPPKAHGLFKAAAGRMRDGGPMDAGSVRARQQNFNLSNDEDRAQGSETDWSIPTSISHLISGQLRQASYAQDDAYFSLGGASQVAASDPMGAFATSMVMEDLGNMEMEEAPDEMEQALGTKFATPVGGSYYTINGQRVTEAEYRAYQAQQQQANLDKVKAEGGKFPTYMKGWDANGGFKDPMDRYRWQFYDKAGYDAALITSEDAYFDILDSIPDGASDADYEDAYSRAEKARNEIYMSAYSEFYNSKVGPNAGQMVYDPDKGYTTIQAPRAPSTGTGGGNTTNGIPNLPNTNVEDDRPTDDDIFGQASNQYYNPWSRLQGGSTNSYGPSQETLNQGTMQAMSLANAYFAPQRVELAYELGDMETDMRRMAVNLGRQVDDPVLQAKLYKEASRAVRTLDVQQNTLAFQMADQRRKEDIANFQFYDQLAAQEAQLKLANRQFYDKFNLDKRYYNLENWNAQQNAILAGGANQAPPTGQSPASTQQMMGAGNLLNGYKVY